MRRVSFCGPSGSGKTTLATWLADELGAPLNPIGSRSVAIEMGFASPYDVDAAGMRAEFQEQLQRRKIAWEQAHDSFVTDRTTLDEYVYAQIHDPSGVSQHYATAAFAHFARYTHVFYCPFDVFCDLAGDPKRMQSYDYQRDFDRILRSILPPRVVRLDVAHLETRKRVVMETLFRKKGDS